MRTALCVSFLLGVAALPAQEREFGTAVPTTLTQVRAEPEAFKNVKVRFTIQFASLGKISNPFFTKFTPTDYANFYGWSDEQPIWQQAAYEDLFGCLFLAKSHEKLEQLYQLKLYERVHVTGIVRNTFQSMPWIEVVDFDLAGSRLDTAVLTHLYRGEQLMEQRLWQRAIAELSLAPGSGVPESAMRAAQRNLGICLLRIGESQAAIACLQSAAGMTKGTDHELETMLALARTQPDQAIDRTVDSRSLRDSERPMWEAFDADRTRPSPKPMR